MEIRVIEISKDKLNEFITTHKVIGEGTEGTCYKVGNKVYKIYHNLYGTVGRNEHIKVDKEGVRIYKKRDYKDFHFKRGPVLSYQDSEGVSLTVRDGLNRAMDKGLKIIQTRLPEKIITVDGRVKGCVYPYYKFTRGIYKSFRKTFKTRLKICKDLLIKVQELLDNNIYPVDLCNKNKTKIFNKNDNNVLLDLKNKPIIIDLEGRSTLYTDYNNPSLKSKSYYSLTLLILEILTKEILTIPLEEEAIDEVYSILYNFGLSDELIYNILNDDVSRDDIDQIMEIAEKKLCKH